MTCHTDDWLLFSVVAVLWCRLMTLFELTLRSCYQADSAECTAAPLRLHQDETRAAVGELFGLYYILAKPTTLVYMYVSMLLAFRSCSYFKTGSCSLHFDFQQMSFPFWTNPLWLVVLCCTLPIDRAHIVPHPSVTWKIHRLFFANIIHLSFQMALWSYN